MKKEFGLLGGLALSILAAIGTTQSFAQEPSVSAPAPEAGVRVEFERMQGPEGPLPPPPPGDFIFLATEMSFGGKLVKGAPYSAQAITETTQTLSDGNRIVNKSTAAVYRDSEGRTRREQTFKAIGSFANGGDPPQTIFIEDPVSGTSYTLDSRAHIARRMPPMRFKFDAKAPPPGKRAGPPQEGPESFHIEIAPDAAGDKRMMETGVAMAWLDTRNPKANTESLGRQNIGGVEADGTRSTVTIAAGEIGNEKPIEIVSERWYSPELQTVVMTRHSDPRFGETTYRLTNIDRSEPARLLFEVPADYTVKEGPPAPERMLIKKPANNPD
jgi:hypothetical protein